jgi:hypothetical protein
LDYRLPKLFVGDSNGRIFTGNIKNGAKMIKFERQYGVRFSHYTSEGMRKEKILRPNLYNDNSKSK